MPYNWECCSSYPNNFGASALYRNFNNNKRWNILGRVFFKFQR